MSMPYTLLNLVTNLFQNSLPNLQPSRLYFKIINRKLSFTSQQFKAKATKGKKSPTSQKIDQYEIDYLSI